MVRTAILKIDNASSILAAPNPCGELAEGSIAPVSNTGEVCTHLRQFESDTPRPIYISVTN